VSGFAPRFTITNAITAGLTTIERARGFLEGATLSDEWVRRMSQRALLLEAHHTTHIEGTHLTIEQSEHLWAGRPVAGAQADDVRELLNYREAFNLVSEYLESGEPVTEGLIREIHKRLVDGVRGAEVYVRPDVSAMGPDISSLAGKDVLLRDTIVYLTCLHETGHALGLSHTADFPDIMYSFGFGGDIPEYFGRYRRKLQTRADIAKNSGMSPQDQARLIQALK